VKSPVTLIAVLALAIGSLQASDSDAPALPDAPRSTSNASAIDAEPPSSTVGVGDTAPNFAYETPDHHNRRLRDLLAQGSVLLIFAPTEDQLKVLEHERDSMLQRGVLPVAVMDRRDSAARSLASRLRLHYPVLGDPRGVISEQFNLLDPTGPRCRPGWFVVDRQGRVRGLHRAALPESDFTSLATRALGLPADGATLPASH
jgi:peroxiredoxin